jgi:hypothetical protein
LDPDGNDIADDTTAAVEDISDGVECNDNDTIGESGSTDHVHKKRRTSRNTSSNSTASDSISRGKGKGKARQIKEPEPEPELFKVLTEDEIRNKVSNNFLHAGVPLYA